MIHNRRKEKHVKPWLWWDFMMAFPCILIIPSALPESLSYVPRHKCSCLIPSEDVLVWLYESNLRISAWIGRAWGQPSHVFFKGRGWWAVALDGPFGTGAAFQIRSAGSGEPGRLFSLAISHVAPLIGRKAKIAFTGAHSSSRQW